MRTSIERSTNSWFSVNDIEYVRETSKCASSSVFLHLNTFRHILNDIKFFEVFRDVITQNSFSGLKDAPALIHDLGKSYFEYLISVWRPCLRLFNSTISFWYSFFFFLKIDFDNDFLWLWNSILISERPWYAWNIGKSCSLRVKIIRSVKNWQIVQLSETKVVKCNIISETRCLVRVDYSIKKDYVSKFQRGDLDSLHTSQIHM